MSPLKITLLACAFLVFQIGAGEKSYCQGPPRDDFRCKEWVSDVNFDPPEPETGSTLRLRFKTQCPFIRVEVKWFVNGEEVELSDYDGVSNYVELQKTLTAGDTVKAEVNPFDATGEKGPVITKTVVCRGAPPSLRLVDQKLEGENYVAKVEVKDPQESPCTLNIQGPEGMRIDHTGNITWKIAENTSGKFQVKVSAKNEQGAEAILSYSFSVRR